MTFDGGSPFNPNSSVYDTRVGYLLWGSFLTFCAIAYYIIKKREVQWLEVPPEPRHPDDIPSPEETKRAHNQLRLALALKDEAFEEKNARLQLAKLGDATLALARARSLDPRVTVEDKSADEPYTYTMDGLAGQLLYFEALLHRNIADAEDDAAIGAYAIKWVYNKHMEESRAAIKQARLAIQKALKYDPNMPSYVALAIMISRRSGDQKAADKLLDHALSRWPDNIEFLKLDSSR